MAKQPKVWLFNQQGKSDLTNYDFGGFLGLKCNFGGKLVSKYDF